MIYLDTSVALAHLLAQDRSPPDRLWQEPLISSRLLEYELWTGIHARKLSGSHADEVRALLSRVALWSFLRLFSRAPWSPSRNLCGPWMLFISPPWIFFKSSDKS